MRGTGVVVAALSAGLLVACSSAAGAGAHGAASTTPASAASSPQSLRDGVQAALQTMTDAVSSGSAAQYLSVLDPAAPAAFRAHEAAVFGGMRRMAFRSLGFGWDSGRSLPVPPGSRYAAGAAVVAVTVHYCLPSWDPGCVADVVPLTFAPVQGHWYLESDADDAAELRLGVDGEPWELGDVSITSRPTVLVVGDPAGAAADAALAARAEAAVSAVRALWPVPSWNGRVVVYARTEPAFVRHYFGTGQPRVTSTITTLPSHPVVTSADSLDPAAARLIVTPRLITENDAAARVALRREVTRIAFALQGGPPAPTWLVEGIADYTAFHPAGTGTAGGAAELAARGEPAQVRRAIGQRRWTPALIADSRFYRGSSVQVDAAYTAAWMTCLYIAHHYGQGALRALFDAVAQDDPGASPAQVERDALGSVLHTDHSHLVAAVAAYASTLR